MRQSRGQSRDQPRRPNQVRGQDEVDGINPARSADKQTQHVGAVRKRNIDEEHDGRSEDQQNLQTELLG